MIGNSVIRGAFALMSFSVINVLALFLDSSLKLTSVTNVKTMQLLNQLCNESQGNNSMSRDACYGCFFRATSHQSGYPLLLSMANCADNYLNNTNYGHCAQYLKNATTVLSSSINPNLIYCSFLECIRQVNKDNLNTVLRARRAIADKSSYTHYYESLAKAIRSAAANIWIGSIKKAVCIIRVKNYESNTVRPGAEPIDPKFTKLANFIQDCVMEAARLMPSYQGTSYNLAKLFVNTTACILAKTRCAEPNPITGAARDETWKNSGFNALLVNSDYDINIVRLPFSTHTPDECHIFRNVESADWPTVQC